MAKPTLLELVQELLELTSSDEVNSISDTIESMQYANAVRSVYLHLTETYDLSVKETLFTLTASGDPALPTHMTCPDNIFDVELIRYDQRANATDQPAFTPLNYCDKHTFLTKVSNNVVGTNYMEVTDPASGCVFIVHTHAGPTCWTSFDGGQTIVCDGFNSDVSTTLESSKTQCTGQIKRDLVLADTSEIDLPETLHELLRTQSREFVFDVYFGGSPNKVLKMADESRTRARRRHNKSTNPDPSTKLPDYGRRRR